MNTEKRTAKQRAGRSIPSRMKEVTPARDENGWGAPTRGRLMLLEWSHHTALKGFTHIVAGSLHRVCKEKLGRVFKEKYKTIFKSHFAP